MSAEDYRVAIDRIWEQRAQQTQGSTVERTITIGFEDGFFYAWVNGVPGVYAEASTLSDLFSELQDSLMDYLDDWVEALHEAPNHAGNADVVGLVDWRSLWRAKDHENSVRLERFRVFVQRVREEYPVTPGKPALLNREALMEDYYAFAPPAVREHLEKEGDQ